MGLNMQTLVVGTVVLATAVMVATVWWRIFARAGYPGQAALLMLVPPVNVLMLLLLAFRQWPIELELQRLRDQAAKSTDTLG